MSEARPGGTRTQLLAWILLGVITLGFAWLGAVDPQARVGLHVGVAAALAVASRLPRPALAVASDRVLQVVATTWLLAMPAVAGLIPLSPEVERWVAPGILAARPDDVWWTAALSPEDVLGAVAVIALLAGFAAAAAAWSAQQQGSERLGSVVLVGAGLFGLLGVAHAVGGGDAAFGVIDTTGTASGPFLGPLVNQNHVGSVLLLALPLALSRAFEREGRARVAVGALCVGTFALLLWAGARGPLLIGAALVAREALRRGKWPALAAAVLALPAVVFLGRSADHRVDTVGGRLQIWQDGLSALASHPLFGVGAGGYEKAVEPYRTDFWRATIAHAHNDLLEYVIETGLVGAVALCVAAALLWRWRPRDLEESGRALLVGVGAVFVHALVDFPLSVPAIAMCCGAIAAAVGARTRPVPGAGLRTRRVLFLLTLCNLAAAGLCWQRATADAAEAAVRSWEAAPERGQRGAELLGWWAPWRGWDRLQQAWVAERADDRARALQEIRAFVALAGDDDDALRPAALVLARIGASQSGLELAERARARGDVDYRNHVAIARIAAARGDVDRAVEAYMAAFERDAPYKFVKEAWEVLPVAVFWIDKLEPYPGHTRALALLLTSRGDPEEALLAFDTAMAADPQAPIPPIYALALARGGRVDRALALAEREAAAGDTTWIRLLGEVREVAGDADGAVEAWQQVEGEHPVVRGWIVRLLGKSGDRDKALSMAERYRMQGVWTEAIALEVARIHARSGDAVECRSVAERMRAEPALQAQAFRACSGARVPAEPLAGEEP